MTATERDTPHDLDAEQALIAAMLIWPEAVRSAVSHVSAADFYRPAHRHVFNAIASLHNRGSMVNAVTVADELRSLGLLEQVGGAKELVLYQASSVSAAPHYAQIIARMRAHRDLIRIGGEIAGLGWDTQRDPADSLDHARALLDSVLLVDDDEPIRSVTADALEVEPEDPYDWTIPGFFDRDDRAIFVAPEGFGKSVMLRMVATCAAQGMCPFTHRERKPIRAHLFDFENPRRTIRRAVAGLNQTARTRSKVYDGDRLWVLSEPGGLDLRSRQGVAALERELTASRPDLVCMGPLYKMFTKQPRESDEDVAIEVTSILDRLRTRFGFTLLLEHHAPHGAGLREMRPFGSSIWLRWPEFGFALTPPSKDDRTTLTWGHWRGPRDVRPWPTKLTRGQVWPWTPTWDAGIPSEHQLGLAEEREEF